MAVDLTQFHQLFFDESLESLDALESGLLALPRTGAGPDDLHPPLRTAHSIKGAASTFGFPSIERLTHAAETVLGHARDSGSPLTAHAVRGLLAAVDCIRDMIARAQAGEAEDTARVDAVCETLNALAAGQDADTSSPRALDTVPGTRAPTRTALRVSVGRLDRVAGCTADVVRTQARVQALVAALDVNAGEDLRSALRALEQSVGTLDEEVAGLRLQPVRVAFDRLPGLVRQLESRLGKRVALTLRGEDTELDRAVIERLADPLVHLVRNAVDHGIESPARRMEAGKPETGRIQVSARHADDEVVVAVEDDGAGLDTERVLDRARRRGLVAGAVEPGDATLSALLFVPGFSTAERISRVSGRGVGLDVVRQCVDALGGRVDARSSVGGGCCFELRLPRFLASSGICTPVDVDRRGEVA